jgi:hypothetical protein
VAVAVVAPATVAVAGPATAVVAVCTRAGSA